MGVEAGSSGAVGVAGSAGGGIGGMGRAASSKSYLAPVSENAGIKFDLGPKPNLAGGLSIKGGEFMTKQNEIKFSPVGTIKFASAETEQVLTAVPEVFIKAFEQPVASPELKTEPITIPGPAVLEPAPSRFFPGMLLVTKTIGIFAGTHLLQAETYPTLQTHRPTQAEVRVRQEGVSESPTKHEFPSHQEEIEMVEEVVEVHREPKRIEEVDEEESRRKILLVKDKPVIERRIARVKEAFKIAVAALGFGEKVAGSAIGKAVDQSDISLLSGIVQPDGPDGSLEETVKELKTGIFGSEDEVLGVVLKHQPVKEGNADEEPATKEEIDEVTRHRIIKPLVSEIVERRIVRKKLAVPPDSKPVIGFGGEVSKPKIENDLQDLDLADVFPKAA